MEDTTKTSISDAHARIKFWCWAVLIIALAIFLAMLLFHLAYWLMVIGAVTVIVLAVWLAFYAERTVHKIKQSL